MAQCVELLNICWGLILQQTIESKLRLLLTSLLKSGEGRFMSWNYMWDGFQSRMNNVYCGI